MKKAEAEAEAMKKADRLKAEARKPNSLQPESLQPAFFPGSRMKAN